VGTSAGTVSRAPSPSGDLHLGNVQFAPGAPDRVDTIFDWDMATLGDPLADFAGLLVYWPDDGELPSVRPIALGGDHEWPPRQELRDRYASATGLDLEAIAWYEAFARWKAAVVRQQLAWRYAEGKSSDPRLAAAGDTVPLLADGALIRLREHLG